MCSFADRWLLRSEINLEKNNLTRTSSSRIRVGFVDSSRFNRSNFSFCRNERLFNNYWRMVFIKKNELWDIDCLSSEFFFFFSINGGRLFDFLCSKSIVTEHQISKYVRQLFDGLNFLHQSKIVHLDLEVKTNEKPIWFSIDFIFFSAGKSFNSSRLRSSENLRLRRFDAFIVSKICSTNKRKHRIRCARTDRRSISCSL